MKRPIIAAVFAACCLTGWGGAGGYFTQSASLKTSVVPVTGAYYRGYGACEETIRYARAHLSAPPPPTPWTDGEIKKIGEESQKEFADMYEHRDRSLDIGTDADILEWTMGFKACAKDFGLE